MSRTETDGECNGMASQSHCKNLRHNPTSAQCMEHYGCIYENNHLVTLLIDPDSGLIVDANKSACEFYGYSLKELRGLHIADINGESGDKTFLRKVNEPGYGPNRIFLETHRLASGMVTDVEIHTGRIPMLGKECIYTVIHDVKERVVAERRLKESESRYRDLVELCPEAILVYRKGVILFANMQAEKLLGCAEEKLIGEHLSAFMHESFLSSNDYLQYREDLLPDEAFRTELRFVRRDGRLFELEVSGAPIRYEGEEAVQAVLRDITNSKKEMERAVKLQQHRQSVDFPLPEKASLQRLFEPAGTLSGDFFIFHKINEEEIVGILGDVTGKGLAAALSISALRVLFMDCVLEASSPVSILQELNRRVIQHLDEDYIAACCFRLDFRNKVLQTASAGINEFLQIEKGREAEKRIIKGAPIGMFADSEFEEVSIGFQSGDSFCFYSDGLELLMGVDRMGSDYEALQARIYQTQELQDDCTWLKLTIL